MRYGLLIAVPMLGLAACGSPPDLTSEQARLSRNAYRAQAIDECTVRMGQDPALHESQISELCNCIGDTIARDSSDEQLRDYVSRYSGSGAMPPEVAQSAEQQCRARGLGAPPPAEEPPPSAPPSLNGGMPPPVVTETDPQEEPAPGNEIADGPDAGAGASAPGGARARTTSLASYITADDYPPVALRNNEQGRVSFVLDIGPDGRPTACRVTQSSGSARLDDTTCRIMRSRARYTPARNRSGQAVADRDHGMVRWALPD